MINNNMNWDNYLLESKTPAGTYAHLGVLEGQVTAPFDLSVLPADTKILGMSTPLKKFKLHYSNLSTLSGNTTIEALSVNDLDQERLDVIASWPNLKYLQISNNQQEEIPDLSSLKSLEVLVLANIKKVADIDFLKGLQSLKTLYIYGINNLYDLTPIANLSHLKELFIDHGKMSGTGKPVKSLAPLSALEQLQYLHIMITTEEKAPDLTVLYNLKNLQKLSVLPRYLKTTQKEQLLRELPLLKE